MTDRVLLQAIFYEHPTLENLLKFIRCVEWAVNEQIMPQRDGVYILECAEEYYHERKRQEADKDTSDS